MIKFAALVEKEKQKTFRAVEQETIDLAVRTRKNWQDRYGNNSRIHGPPLAESTVKRKGNNDMLVDRLNRIAESIEKPRIKRTIVGNNLLLEVSVTTDHWLFPIHEYGLNAPPSWEGTAALQGRQTLELTKVEVASKYPVLIKRRLKQIIRK